MGNSNKGFIGLIGVVILIILIPIVFNSIKTKEGNKYDVEPEPELYVEQIWFKNIEMLNEIPIDQNLLIQDEITYYFKSKEKQVEEIELQEGTLNNQGDNKIEFKAIYNAGIITVKVNGDKVNISE